MEIKELYKIFKESTGVTTDTRKIVKGNIYFALKGENFNGNDFALEALKKGAIVSVVDEEVEGDNTNVIKVDNVLEALQKLARYYRDSIDISVIGLTGSNGKTTTKELLAAVLETEYKIHYTPGNYNNHIGVPLTLLGMTADSEMAIIEMGANHVGEIAELCEIANPNFGLITNIGRAHLEGFGSVEGIIKGKSELYQYVKKNEGVFFYNAQDPVLSNIIDIKKYIPYKVLENTNQSISLQFQYESELVKTNLFGDYNLINAAAAITIAEYFKIDFKNIKKSLEAYIPTNNRSQIVKHKNATIILDAYNANPSSMFKSIESFKAIKGAKMAIVGSMKELGDYSADEHQSLIDFLSTSDIQKIILIGIEFSGLSYSDKFTYLETVQQISENTFDDLCDEYNYVLIKGSRSNKLESLVLTR